jgi:hypothetical protein
MIKESDWKKFTVLKREALQRYCARVLDELRDSIDREGATPHERYSDVFQFVQDSDRRLSAIFDDHTRSFAHMQFRMIRAAELVGPDDFEGFSEAFLDRTTPFDLDN